MALSGSLSTNDYDGRYYKLSWTATQSVATNKSTINWTLEALGGSSNWYAERTLEVVIAGSTVVSKTDRVQRYKGVIQTGSLTLTHDAQGKKSFSASIKAAVYGTAVNLTGSSTFTLNTIARYATLTAAPNFLDTENPTITYSNPAGNNVTSLKVGIFAPGLTGATYCAYRDISKTGTSYTFTLTDAERDALITACTGANMQVVFKLQTLIGGEYFFDALTKTFYVADAAPYFGSITLVDGNETTVALTGDNTKLVKGYSNANITVFPIAQKKATIKETTITNGSTTVKASIATFNNVESATFKIKATDSRDMTVSETLNADMVDYIKLTANLEATAPNTDGEMSFTVKGNYFNGSFGAVNNSLSVMYRMRENDGSYGDWITTGGSLSISGNTYTTTYNLTGLNYRNTYQIEVKVEDKLLSLTAETEKLRAITVFDWSYEDFNFNVPITLDGIPLIKRSNTSPSVFFGTEAGSVYLRPNGITSTEGQARLYPDGNFAIKGDLKIGDNTLNDYVVEQGTSGIWTYRKWNSGLSECWGGKQINLITAAWGAWGNIYYCIADTGSYFVFPSGVFSAAPKSYAQITTDKGNAWAQLITSTGTATTPPDICFYTPVKQTATVITYNYFYCQGNWK